MTNKAKIPDSVSHVDQSGIKNKILVTIETLQSLFGLPDWRRKDPLDELMLTLLSQNTNDHNRDHAYRRLRSQFPTWSEVSAAGAEAVEECIRPAGLSNQKSQRMIAILSWIKEYFGELNLEALRERSDDEVISVLTQQKGIGVKTAAVMLAFSLDRDLCPVDTHVHRISKRLGWVAENTNAEQTFYQLRALIPPRKAATFHLNLLKFGRTICQARKPQCPTCPLREVCLWEHKLETKL